MLGPGQLALKARQQVAGAGALFAAGKTVREIAQATGTSKSTAARDAGLSQSGTTSSDRDMFEHAERLTVLAAGRTPGKAPR